MPYIVGLVIAVAAVLAFWFYGRRNARRPRGTDLMELRQAENTVKVSDPILRKDIASWSGSVPTFCKTL